MIKVKWNAIMLNKEVLLEDLGSEASARDWLFNFKLCVEKIPYSIQDLNEDTLKTYVNSVFICTGSDYKYLLTNKKNNG